MKRESEFSYFVPIAFASMFLSVFILPSKKAPQARVVVQEQIQQLKLVALEPFEADPYKITSYTSPKHKTFAGADLPVFHKKNLKIMVMDTGVSYHSKLAPWVKSPIPDSYGHGTHVAGIVALGRSNQEASPLCDQVEIIPCRIVFEQDAVFDTTKACIAKAIAEKVDIINYSIDGRDYQKEEFDLWNKFTSNGGVLVTAAGNGARDIILDPTFPASWGLRGQLKNTFVIANVNDKGELALNSNFYPGMIAEVGVDTLSTVPREGMIELSGTSMAAPLFVHKIAQKFCYFQPRNFASK